MNTEHKKAGASLPSGATPRALLRHEFLEKCGLDPAAAVPLAGDASSRSYFRLPQGILMDAPEGVTSFETVQTLLKTAGLSVPQIYGTDADNGFLLLEDFGDLSFRTALQKGADEPTLYKEVVAALRHLHLQTFSEGFIPPYTVDTFLKMVNLFLEWSPFSFSDNACSAFLGLWEEAYHKQPAFSPTVMLRDVMVDNLFWLPDRQGIQRCGFIDFQDASLGPAVYDLTSVLEDIRRDDLPPACVHAILEDYFEAFPELTRQDFWDSYCLWGAQRSVRIIGIFYRLAKRDSKPQYLRYLPRLWHLLERQLTAAPLRDIADWFKANGVWA